MGRSSSYEVVVGNVGTVYRGYSPEKARAEYDECVEWSKSGFGLVANEPATLFRNGEILDEYDPSAPAPPDEPDEPEEPAENLRCASLEHVMYGVILGNSGGLSSSQVEDILYNLCGRVAALEAA
jgi:hypothetical protein